jgi:predicted acetyltransferase
MAVDIRPLRPGEQLAFVQSVRVPFLDPTTDHATDRERDARRAEHVEVDRSWVAEDGGRFVANACIDTMDVTVPAAPGRPAAVVPMAGVSAVGVHPTHRRKGVLSQLMALMLDDARRRAEPLAGLIASESVIYGRFGFGLATDMVEWTIDCRHTDFLVPAPDAEIRLVDADEATKTLPEIFDRQRRGRAGEPGRNDLKWREVLADERDHRGGASARFIAACDEGYVSYRVLERDVLRAERCTAIVEEMRGCSPDVEAALWRFVFDLDLVGDVKARRRPVDEPLRWRLSDPRQLRIASVDDRLYIRVLDVPAAFEARGYRSAGRLVLEVGRGAGEDPALGRWVLDAGPDGASCRRARAGEDADVQMGLTELGALYMGGVSASVLAAAGRVAGLKAGSLEMADRLFLTSPAPLSGTGF